MYCSNKSKDTETQLQIFMQNKFFFKKVIGGGFGDLNEWEKTNVSKPFKVTFFFKIRFEPAGSLKLAATAHTG